MADKHPINTTIKQRTRPWAIENQIIVVSTVTTDQILVAADPRNGVASEPIQAGLSAVLGVDPSAQASVTIETQRLAVSAVALIVVPMSAAGIVLMSAAAVAGVDLAATVLAVNATAVEAKLVGLAAEVTAGTDAEEASAMSDAIHIGTTAVANPGRASAGRANAGRTGGTVSSEGLSAGPTNSGKTGGTANAGKTGGKTSNGRASGDPPTAVTNSRVVVNGPGATAVHGSGGAAPAALGAATGLASRESLPSRSGCSMSCVLCAPSIRIHKYPMRSQNGIFPRGHATS